MSVIIPARSKSPTEVRSESLHILYVLPYTPSPIRVRPYQNIRALARLGHRVTVVALADSFATEAVLSELQSVCAGVHIVPNTKVGAALRCLLALPTPTPLWAAYCQVPAMARLLQHLLRSETFDVAHIEHLRAAHFATELGTLPRVLDAVDCITTLQRQVLDQGATGLKRLLAWEEWSKLCTYEPQVYRDFAHIAVTSVHDAESLRTLGREKLPPVTVIPNGVDLEHFQPQPGEIAEPETIVFSGKMSYVANNDAATYLLTEIVPRLREQVPGVRVVLAGSSPSAKLRALAEAVGNVTVTGFVDDLRPSIRQATLAICPMRIGVGIQNKALEAMALGRPVVASSLAARTLSGAVAVGAVRVADTTEDYVNFCADWLKNHASAQEAGRQARNYVEVYHRWEVVAQQFLDLYRSAKAATVR